MMPSPELPTTALVVAVIRKTQVDDNARTVLAFAGSQARGC